MLDHRTETEAAVAVENLLLLRRQDLDELLERAAALGAADVDELVPRPQRAHARRLGDVAQHLGVEAPAQARNGHDFARDAGAVPAPAAHEGRARRARERRKSAARG